VCPLNTQNAEIQGSSGEKTEDLETEEAREEEEKLRVIG
jgi:hypothetical protein